MYAGIDYSMTCPAITVGPSKDFNKCKTFYYIKDKKYIGNFHNPIFSMQQHIWTSQEERFDLISEWALSILKRFKVYHACLEGYSMGSKGNISGICENGGLLKHKLWKNDINFIVVAPTQIKKYFCGKGNGNKELMFDEFLSKTNVNLLEESLYKKCKKSDNPISDIIDSYAMLCYCIENKTGKVRYG